MPPEFLGEGGRGLSGEADVVIGTFSKALGGFGAYVACSDTLRDYLINRCSGLIYSTALPPPVLGAIDAALDLVPSLDAERAHVASLAERFRLGARALGFDTGASTTQIVPLIAGSNHAALSLSKRLRDAGYFVTAIRPPTVPAGTARLRFAFTAAHTAERHRRPAQCARRPRFAAQRHGVNRPTPKMHFVFVHGWGFNPAIWRDVIGNIGNAEVTLIDLGFIAGGPKAAATWPSDAIAVGHSLGLLWLLHRAGEEEGAALPRPGQHPGLRPLLSSYSAVAGRRHAAWASPRRRPDPCGLLARLRH